MTTRRGLFALLASAVAALKIPQASAAAAPVDAVSGVWHVATNEEGYIVGIFAEPRGFTRPLDLDVLKAS